MRDSSDFLVGVELVTTRGTMDEIKSVQTRRLAAELTDYESVDWVSITDNAGGNPMLSPIALGKNILYGGKEVLIHLSCKDFNRNGLESEAWQLASEGFQNILALSGDYPASGYHGNAKPVFDIDSIGLLTLLGEMNQGLDRPSAGTASSAKLKKTNFFTGAVATNFKLFENEVVPQYLKMEKKIELGASFIIAQIGFDSRKSHEMVAYLTQRGHGNVPLIGNVFLLSFPVAKFFRSQKIPGVVVSNALFERCQAEAQRPDRGRNFFLELAARQLAIFRGLGFRGVYLGGVHSMAQIQDILERANRFTTDDWREFAKEICYGRKGEFYLYDQDSSTGLANPAPSPEGKTKEWLPQRSKHVTWGYRLNHWVHRLIFQPGTRLFRWGETIYRRASNKQQGPSALRVLEHASKSVMFGCKDCGDCSLPDIAYLCPESQCAKNQRNGPCGGTRDGLCEVDDFPCIWSRAYDRLKFRGNEQHLLDHAPVIQNETLRGTSSWANTFLGRDHHSKQKKSVLNRTNVPLSENPCERNTDTSKTV